MSKLFSLFGKLKRTAQQNSEGIGMGLMICKNLVEANRGILKVRSEGENCGSSFMFTMQMFTEAKSLETIYVENQSLQMAENHT